MTIESQLLEEQRLAPSFAFIENESERSEMYDRLSRLMDEARRGSGVLGDVIHYLVARKTEYELRVLNPMRGVPAEQAHILRECALAEANALKQEIEILTDESTLASIRDELYPIKE